MYIYIYVYIYIHIYLSDNNIRTEYCNYEKNQKRLETKRNNYHLGDGKTKAMECYDFN